MKTTELSDLAGAKVLLKETQRKLFNARKRRSTAQARRGKWTHRSTCEVCGAGSGDMSYEGDDKWSAKCELEDDLCGKLWTLRWEIEEYIEAILVVSKGCPKGVTS